MTALADSSRSTGGHVTVQLVVGETIGQYRVTGVIGRGGMGAVYAAEHTLLGRPAAVKVLLSELSQKQNIVMRFFNEAKAATAIRHPGIVEIYDFGWGADGSAYIVMEHLQGESLYRRASRGRLPWQAALGVARQIAGALAAAHGKGIIHRDLKPDNVFLVPDPEVPGGERIKLLDFGIAKLAGDSTGAKTDTGVVIGTPTYMAPEQCRGILVDHRADLYSLGCVIFELCAGRAPFVGEGPGDVLAAHIHISPPKIGSLVPEISPAAERLIQHLLAKRPEDRPQSADEVIQQIDHVTSGAHRRVLRAGTSAHVGVAASASSRVTHAGANEATMTTVTATTAVTTSASRKAAIGVGVAIVGIAIVASIVIAMPGAVVRVDATPTPAARTPAPSLPAPVAAPPAPPAIVEAPAPWPSPPGAAPPAPPSMQVAPSPPIAEVVDLVIESSPAGADIVLHDDVLGKTPFRGTITRRDADVTIVVRLRGYADKRIVAHADKPITRRIKLVGLAQPVIRRKDRNESVNPFAE